VKKRTNKNRKTGTRSTPELDRGSSEFSPSPRPRLGTNFREAEGKVVHHINYYSRPEVYQAVEVRFTDGTFLEFELIPMVQVKSAFKGSKKGDVSCIRDYGVLPDESEVSG
jgi:hypothetical protein